MIFKKKPASATSESTESRSKSPPSEANSAMDHFIHSYGDLIFDLCESVLASPANAQLAFREILKAIRNRLPQHGFFDHERAWVIHVAREKLVEISARHGHRMTASEQIELEATPGINSRLQKFGSYFHRLPTEDQVLLLLRDKYGLPYPEISAAMGVPEGSLKIKRSQALRTLEEWLWDIT